MNLTRLEASFLETGYPAILARAICISIRDRFSLKDYFSI